MIGRDSFHELLHFVYSHLFVLIAEFSGSAANCRSVGNRRRGVEGKHRVQSLHEVMCGVRSQEVFLC